MNRRFVLLALALLASLLAVPAVANAATAVFTKPQVLAADGIEPAVSIGPGGDVVVAWVSVNGGLFVARRGPLDGGFGTAVKFADDAVGGIRLARNDRGDLAMAWNGEQGIGFTRVPAGSSAFGPVEHVRGFHFPEVAMADDGTVVMTFVTFIGIAAAYSAVRPPGGRFGEPKLLGKEVIITPKVVSGSGGSFHAVWTANTSPYEAPRRVAAMAADMPAGGAFGSAQRLSDPRTNMTLGQDQAYLVANQRGDLVAAWVTTTAPVVITSTTQAGDRVEIAERPAGGGWSAPRVMPSPAADVTGVDVALNDAGDAAVVWHDRSVVKGFGRERPGMRTSFRAAGGSFGPPADLGFAADPFYPVLALDADGVALVMRAQGALDGPGLMTAMLRVRDGAVQPAILVSGLEPSIVLPVVATDRFGNGVAAWSGNYPTYGVSVVTYSRRAPQIERMRVRSSDFRFRSSEAARMRIIVSRRGGGSASQKAVVGPGANTVRFARGVRRLLRRPGRYVATVRSADAGPRKKTIKIRFKRR